MQITYNIHKLKDVNDRALKETLLVNYEKC